VLTHVAESEIKRESLHVYNKFEMSFVLNNEENDNIYKYWIKNIVYEFFFFINIYNLLKVV
jgi:hypothetical protein